MTRRILFATISAGSCEGKNDINARIDYFGFGIDLKTERPTPAKIAKGVTRVLRDPRFARNVERIRAEFATYRPLDLIDGFIAAGDADEPPIPERLVS